MAGLSLQRECPLGVPDRAIVISKLSARRGQPGQRLTGERAVSGSFGHGERRLAVRERFGQSAGHSGGIGKTDLGLGLRVYRAGTARELECHSAVRDRVVDPSGRDADPAAHRQDERLRV